MCIVSEKQTLYFPFSFEMYKHKHNKLCIELNNKSRAKCPPDSGNDNHPQLNPVKTIFQAGPFKCSIAGALLGVSILGNTHAHSICPFLLHLQIKLNLFIEREAL